MEKSSAYSGPLRNEPVAIELHNTLYATADGAVDALASIASTEAFLRDLSPRLNLESDLEGPPPGPPALRHAREVVRTALHAAVDGADHDSEAIDELNRLASAAPRSLRADITQPPAQPQMTHDFHGADRCAATLAAFATDTIRLITSPAAHQIHLCGAPGCVLMYLTEDPRRRWCSNACGNRARQARHYHRHRAQH